MSSASSAPNWTVAFDTVPQMFRDAVEAHPDRIYCKASEIVLSYAHAACAIQAVADDLGPKVLGRTVALVLPNSPAFLVAYLGALVAGAHPALVNYGHPDATVIKLLQGLDMAAVLSDRDIPGLTVTGFDDAKVRDLAEPLAAVDITFRGSPTDVGAILFSGGTTGLPKQVAHSHEALVRKIERMEWGWPTNDGEIWLPVAPFTHVYGFLMGC